MTRRRFRSWLFAASFLLLLGAVINVALAWCLALWSPIRESESHGLVLKNDDPQIPPEWRPTLASERQGVLLNIIRDDGFGMGEVFTLVEPAWLSTSFVLHGRVEFTCGWPFHCMRWRSAIVRTSTGSFDLADPGGVEAPDSLGNEHIVLPGSVSVNRRLPLLPIPLGFAANTLIFALAGGALFAAPRAVRHQWRKRAGRCTHCGYMLGVTAPCPECGRTP